jgi:hypothetical protein
VHELAQTLILQPSCGLNGTWPLATLVLSWFLGSAASDRLAAPQHGMLAAGIEPRSASSRQTGPATPKIASMELSHSAADLRQ